MRNFINLVWRRLEFWQSKLSANSFIILAALGGLFLSAAPLIFSAVYNQPFNDDYCFTLTYRHYGFAGSFWYIYNNSLGRFSSTALILWLSSFWQSHTWLVLIKLLPVLLVGLLFLSLWFFINNFLGRLLQFWEKFVVSALVFTAALASMPSLSEGLFWAASTLTHEFGLVFMLLVFGIIARFYRSSASGLISRWLMIALAGILTLAAVGMDEISLCLTVLVLICLIFIRWKNEQQKNAVLWFLLTLALIGAAFVFSSPGNWGRFAIQGSRPSLLFVFSAATFSGLTELFGWFNPVVLLSGLLAVPFFAKLSKALGLKNYIHPFLSVIVSLLLIIGLTAVPILAAGVNPAPRVWDMINFIFIVLWFANIFILVDYIIKKYSYNFSSIIGWQQNRDVVMLVWLVFLFLVLNNKNINAVWQDLGRGRTAQFSSILNQRTAQLSRLGQKDKDVIFDPLPVMPEALFVGELDSKTTASANYCVAKYFNVKSVKIKE